MHIFWGLGCKHIFWGTTIQSAADLLPQCVGLPEGSLCYHLSFRDLPCPRFPFMGSPYPKLIKVDIKARPPWPNLEQHRKTIPVSAPNPLPPPTVSWGLYSDHSRAQPFCLIILLSFLLPPPLPQVCLTGTQPETLWWKLFIHLLIHSANLFTLISVYWSPTAFQGLS